MIGEGKPQKERLASLLADIKIHKNSRKNSQIINIISVYVKMASSQLS